MADLRLAVLGDSLSAGVGDPTPGPRGLIGGLDGWPHHLQTLAHACGVQLELIRLARNAAHAPTVRRNQLAPALRSEPDLATVFVGTNDVFVPGFDVGRFEADLDACVGALAAVAGHGVLTATLHDATADLPVRAAARRRQQTRTDAANEAIRSTARRHGARVVDLAAAQDLRRDRLLSLDRLHPNRSGHWRVAQEVAGELMDLGVLPTRRGLLEPRPRPAGWDALPARAAEQLAHLTWLAVNAPAPLWRGRALRRRTPEVPRDVGQLGPGPGG